MSLPPDETSRESRANETDTEPDVLAPAPAPVPRRKAPLTTALCALYIVGVAGVLVLMRLAGERWWFATLLLFSPRWIWAAPLIALLPLALAFRWRMTIPLLLAGAVVLFAVTGFRIPWRNALPASSRTRQAVRLFTCNLHNLQSDPLLLEQLLAASPPDIILYQDYNHARQPGLARTPGWHGEQYNGVYLASHFPFRREADLLPRDDAARQYARHGWPVGDAICYAIDLPDGQTIHLINVHLASAHQQLAALRNRNPAGPAALQADSERRAFESITVAAAARQIGGPFIIAGDFNTPDDSPLFGAAWKEYDDAFNTAGFGFGTTYANHYTWLRIDHVLCNPSWHCAECRVGPPIGSGHRPIYAVLER